MNLSQAGDEQSALRTRRGSVGYSAFGHCDCLLIPQAHGQLQANEVLLLVTPELVHAGRKRRRTMCQCSTFKCLQESGRQAVGLGIARGQFQQLSADLLVALLARGQIATGDTFQDYLLDHGKLPKTWLTEKRQHILAVRGSLVFRAPTRETGNEWVGGIFLVMKKNCKQWDALAGNLLQLQANCDRTVADALRFVQLAATSPDLARFVEHPQQADCPARTSGFSWARIWRANSGVKPPLPLSAQRYSSDPPFSARILSRAEKRIRVEARSAEARGSPACQLLGWPGA